MPSIKRTEVKPGTGRLVRDESGLKIPKSGQSVPLNSFWTRKLKSGDVVLKNPPKTETNNNITK